MAAGRQLPPRLGACTLSTVAKSSGAGTQAGQGTAAQEDARIRAQAAAILAAPEKASAQAHNPYANPDYTPSWWENHAGKLGFAVIGLIASWFYKSSCEADHFDEMKDTIMSNRPIAPAEMGALRRANNAVQAVHFVRIHRKLTRAFPGGSGALVPVAAFNRCLAEELPAACPNGIVNGHAMERVLLALQLHYGALAAGASLEETREPRTVERLLGREPLVRRTVMLAQRDAAGRPPPFADKLPLQLLMVVLTALVNGSVEERVQLLFDVMSPSGDPLRRAQIVDLVGDLQLAFQIPAPKSIVTVGPKYPYPQAHHIISPDALVQKALDTDLDSIKKVKDLIDADAAQLIELQMFLKSLPICAWGECLGKPGQGLKKWKDL